MAAHITSSTSVRETISSTSQLSSSTVVKAPTERKVARIRIPKDRTGEYMEQLLGVITTTLEKAIRSIKKGEEKLVLDFKIPTIDDPNDMHRDGMFNNYMIGYLFSGLHIKKEVDSLIERFRIAYGENQKLRSVTIHVHKSMFYSRFMQNCILANLESPCLQELIFVDQREGFYDRVAGTEPDFESSPAEFSEGLLKLINKHLRVLKLPHLMSPWCYAMTGLDSVVDKIKKDACNLEVLSINAHRGLYDFLKSNSSLREISLTFGNVLTNASRARVDTFDPLYAYVRLMGIFKAPSALTLLEINIVGVAGKRANFRPFFFLAEVVIGNPNLKINWQVSNLCSRKLGSYSLGFSLDEEVRSRIIKMREKQRITEMRGKDNYHCEIPMPVLKYPTDVFDDIEYIVKVINSGDNIPEYARIIVESPQDFQRVMTFLSTNDKGIIHLEIDLSSDSFQEGFNPVQSLVELRMRNQTLKRVIWCADPWKIGMLSSEVNDAVERECNDRLISIIMLEVEEIQRAHKKSNVQGAGSNLVTFVKNSGFSTNLIYKIASFLYRSGVPQKMRNTSSSSSSLSTAPLMLSMAGSRASESVSSSSSTTSIPSSSSSTLSSSSSSTIPPTSTNEGRASSPAKR